MSRAEGLDQDRARIADLGKEHGLKLRDCDGNDLRARAETLRLTRKILQPSRVVIPCRATLKDGVSADPCLIAPSSVPLELLPHHRSVAVGGQVTSIARSEFALSLYLMNESWKAQSYWEGRALPLLVSIRGEYRYLLQPKSYFFVCDSYRASDLDQVSPMEPTARDLKLNRYKWGSDLTEKLMLVIADY